MDTLMKEMSVPLTKIIASFPKHSHLHPFEQALLELTVGLSNYENALARVRCLYIKL
jgi:nucleolar GTP-binding protein